MKSLMLINLALAVSLAIGLNARQSFKAVTEPAPEHGVIQFHLGKLQRLGGEPRLALETLRRALDYQEHPSIHAELGEVSLALGQPQEAVRHFEAALKLDPAHAESHRGLGSYLYSQGRVAEACRHFRRVLQSMPDEVTTLNNLAWILATTPDDTLRNGAEAVIHAERAAVLTGGREPVLLTTLAAAYAAAGRFEDAIAFAEKALGLAEMTASTGLTTTLTSHLAFYRAGQALR